MNIGIIGDGQLGKMLALEGIKLGHKFGFLGVKNSPSSQVGKIFSTLEELDEFADVITYESENINIEPLTHLTTSIYPSLSLLHLAQHRGKEKRLFAELDIPHGDYQIYTPNNGPFLNELLHQETLPVILKTTTNGYDGKGQYYLDNVKNISDAVSLMSDKEVIIEQVIEFDYEVSMIACRTQREIRYYPLTKNVHFEGILQNSTVINNTDLFEQAQKYVELLCNKYDYIGTIAVEFFVMNEILYANEIAPRVHNSGHWSLNGAHTSQFENHIRAITNSPLGNTQATYQDITMHNIIGTYPDANSLLTNPHTSLYLYGKSERAKRKIGHYTICK